MNNGPLYKIKISNVIPSTCINYKSRDKIYNQLNFNSFMENKCIRIKEELIPIHPLDYTYIVDIYDLINGLKLLSDVKLIGSQIKIKEILSTKKLPTRERKKSLKKTYKKNLNKHKKKKK